jgi:hypothetical protein
MSVYTAPRLHQFLLTNGIAVVSVTIGTFGNKATYLVAPSSLQAAAQPFITAFDDSPAGDAADLNLAARANGSSNIDDDHTALWKALRGAAAVLVDELNILRQWEMSLKAAVAAATSLADLKTSVAALPNLPDRTLAQAKSAIQAKITGGVVD